MLIFNLATARKVLHVERFFVCVCVMEEPSLPFPIRMITRDLL